MLYSLIVFYLVFLVYFYDCNNYNNSFKSLHFNFVLIILILIAGLRYRMAPDSVAYVENFNNQMVPLSKLTIESFTESRYQPLWILLNSFVKSFGNYVILQIICSAFLNFCVFYFFKKTSKFFFTCILFYFLIDYFYFSMEIVRESLAISVFLLAMINYNENKKLKAFLLIFVAFLFHHFAAILFILPFFLSNIISFKFKTLSLIGIILYLFTFQDPLIFIDSYLSKFSTVDITFYEVIDFKMSLSGYVYMSLKIIPVIMVMYLYRVGLFPNTYLKKDMLFILSILYVFIILIRVTTIPFIERFSNYFIFFILILITGAIYDVLEKRVIKFFRFKLILLISIICFMFQLLPFLEISPIFGVPLYKRYYPYYSVFSKRTDPDRELMTEMEAKE